MKDKTKSVQLTTPQVESYNLLIKVIIFSGQLNLSK